ncbi:NlpC/P60 family protein [Clostridium magnum]|uniref:Murein DD-endopeptidase MepH n=1 Tax=Clostridium magnum DSM 2767 TaxID=1121326 RepID=A0A162T052_9CLOT|nr:C40 family peptidase [Clostridium magnum]KZL92080.1 murein DD-endopeptidase MepH precursor [Clostridium magnum DSM 2767]SHH23278.1 Cell wall-associated hydrolase, NlpC family [Clostridium magnum DSM 2767]
MDKKIKSMLVALTCVLTINSTVFATPSSSTANKIHEMEAKIESLDHQIETVMSKINSNKKEIAKTQNDIKGAESDLKNAQDDIKKGKVLLGQRMRAMYISGSNGYLSVLLDSNGLEDFISRIDMVKAVISYDNKVIADYKSKADDISKKRDKLTAENKRLLTLKSDNEKKLNQLNSDKDNQKKLIAQAKEQQRLYAAAEAASVSGAAKQVANIRKSAPSISQSRGVAAASANNVIAFASNYMGTPYVWGGSSPNPGFDCSGFTQYVYGHFGVSIGRTTYDQINDGVPVSRGQLQPGDLVLFGSSSNPHHVGIYVGDGAYIHAPRTGDSVKISSLDSRGDFVTGRRVN